MRGTRGVRAVGQVILIVLLFPIIGVKTRFRVVQFGPPQFPGVTPHIIN